MKKTFYIILACSLLTACGKNQQVDLNQTDEMYEAYKDILTNFIEKSELLDLGVVEPELELPKTNSMFAVFDQDGDGYDELVFRYDDGVMAGMQEHVYDYDFEKHTAYLKFSGFYGLDYYENGAIADPLSHGAFKTGDFWPYTLYAVDTSTNEYDEIGYVDAYYVGFYEENKDYMAPEDAFPFDVDKDENGYVYYIDKNDDTHDDRKVAVDDDVYQKWLTSYTDGTKIIEPDYYYITTEYISNIGKGED